MVSKLLLKFTSTPPPFKAYSTFALSLAETLPATPYKLCILEQLYLGKFSTNIGKLSILCNTPALISCMLPTVFQAIMITHKHQPSNISSTSSSTWMAAHTFLSCIPLALVSIPPMTSINIFPQATSTPKRYPMALLLLQIVYKVVPPMTNAQ